MGLSSPPDHQRRWSRRRWDAAERAVLVRAVGLFHGIAATAVDDLAAGLHPRHIQAGGYLFLAGQPADTFHLVAEGRVKVVRDAEEGRQVILRLVGPGEMFGGAGVWDEAVYPASAVAEQDAVVLQMPSRAISALLDRHPEVTKALLREVARRLREAEARIQALQTERVERRIARALLRLANKTGEKTAEGIVLGVRLSRQDLAELAGTTLSTASRTLSAWDQQGIVVAGRQRVTLRRPHELVAIAEELESPPGTSAANGSPGTGGARGGSGAGGLASPGRNTG